MNKEVAAWVDRFSSMPPDEIAQVMRNEGIKGYRLEADSCAVAEFMHAKCDTYVVVSNKEIHIDDSGDYVFHIEGTGLSAFVKRFDDECYPELVHDA